MRKFRFLGAVVASSFLFVCATTQADLNTYTYVSWDDGGDGRFEGDITGVGEVTLYDGEGGDMWNGGDQFSFVHDEARVTGDFTATVRVVAQTESVEGRWGKAGVMATGELDGLAQNVGAQVYSGIGSQVEPPAVGEHSPIPVRIGGRTGTDGQGGFEIAMTDSSGVDIPNNVFPEAEANVLNPTTNVSWIRIQHKADSNSFLAGYAADVDGAPGEWGYSPVVTNVPASEDGWYVGLGYSAHNSLLVNDLDDEDGMHGITFDNYSIVPEYLRPQFGIAGNSIGAVEIGGTTSNVVTGDVKTTQGLSQFWYDANMRANPEGFLEAGDTGTEDYPLVNPGGNPVKTENTWWAGAGDQQVTGVEFPRYPAGLAGTRFDSDDEDDYGVRLTGEIFFNEDGEYLIRDGIDDFTMIAIDQDGNGVLDDLDDLVADDVGTLFPGEPIGDVLVLDDDWANPDGGDQAEDFHGIADIENVGADGAWRKIEIWMSEGGVGDAGIVYMGNLDDDDIFDEREVGALSQEQRDQFVIAGDRLRSEVAEVVSGDSNASARTDVEYVMQIAADGSGDQLIVDDNGGVFTTSLDLSDAVFNIVAEEGLAEGTSVKLFDADSVTGADMATFNFADASQWDLSQIGEGIVTFGTGGGGCDPNTMGDLNGDGNVGFPDFLVLSANFGNDVAGHAEGDVNCDGNVGFPDFLVLSANFGNTVGAQASVPEPSGLALLSVAGLIGGFVRRRRR